jgi:hypothetical protein
VRWFIDHAFLLVPAQAIVAQHIASFREFPPRQRPGSFSVEQAMEKLRLRHRRINSAEPLTHRTAYWEVDMTMASIDSFGPSVRSAVRRHWVLFLIPGVAMVILGLLAAAAPFVATLVIDTFAGWMLLTAGFIGLAALITTRNVPGFMMIAANITSAMPLSIIHGHDCGNSARCQRAVTICTTPCAAK